MNATEFNKRHPIGTKVRYFPIKGKKEHIDTETRSEAWTLGSGHIVVSLKDKSGGVSIEHLEINNANAH